MQKLQIEQYNMLLSIENHFEDNPTIWNAATPINEAKIQLSSKIDLIAAQIAVQMRTQSCINSDKANYRIILQNKGIVLSAAIRAYAVITGKNDLYYRVNLSYTDFERFSEVELIGAIANLHRVATSELVHLAPFGVTATTLANLLTASPDFGILVKKQNETIDKQKSATDKIAALLSEAISFLEASLDHLIVGLIATQPQFAEIYAVVRALNCTSAQCVEYNN